ncbi:response regulator transcription factor [Spirosoma sp. KCTC 42546]|uniref:LytR/AlgR family response regulator transcription factor n=1 Tax=Spirosoma sp. KCTC 42546 TaxID=2520506 RepID=UPI0011579167|nr:LytTR family DNA-binding domain-containing protein [Spirosoma sp. KCTC 42546]QDK83604.1 response regulator transcription factor [Spirosoma sp. KCTC 42546]
MKAIALDDERPALDVIEAFCSRIDFVDLVKTFTRTGEARIYLESNPVDLIFLDINMPKESGLAFFKSITQQTLVIFTTAYSEYALESYDVEAADYLLKPYTFERFNKAMQRAQARWRTLQQINSQNLSESEPTQLFFRADYGLVKVTVADIFFIEGLDNYLKIHVREGQPVVLRLTLKAILDKLPATKFIRVHRSFIVAIDKIQSIRGRMILIGEEEIPIGSSYEKDFFSLFMK